MAKTQTIQKVQGALAERPQFLSDAPIQGVDAMKQLRIFPRFKIVQKSAGAELTKQYGQGDIIIAPDMKLVFKAPRNTNTGMPDWDIIAKGEGFKFIPLFFYYEWLRINPWEKRGELPMIAERTLDPNDPLVQKCKNSKLRQEPFMVDNKQATDKDGKGLFIRNVENLCFIVQLVGHDLGPEVATINCARGGYWAGVQLSNKISARKASIYSCVFEAKPIFRPNPKGDYISFDFNNPSDGNGWVQDKDTNDKLRVVHEELVAVHKAKAIGTNIEEEDLNGGGDGGAPAEDPNKPREF